MSRARKIDVSVETVSTSRLVGYGVESTRLNFDMNTDVPSYGPYEDLQCNVTNGLNDLTNKDHQVEEFDHGLSNIDEDMPNTDSYHELQVPRDSDNALIQNVSPSAFEAFMERMKARDHQTMKILQHDVEHRSIVNLLKILEDSQCPDYMLQSILEWAYNAKVDGFDFNPKATTRKANIAWMYQALEKSHQLLPQVVSTVLEDHDDVANIVCFDFTIALLSLLQNDALMSSENLVINPDDPTSMFRPADNKVGEAHTAQRYRDLYDELITRKNQLLVPIILYLDGTAIDSKGHIELCPVSFTTSLFTEKVRRDSNAWRLLGYVPDLNRGRSAAMNSHANNTHAKGRTTRNFHKVMDVLLKGMAEGQAGKDCRLKNVPLKLCGRWLLLDIVCPLLFVINDGKQGDQLCCRVNGHHSSIRRHHRSCDCLFDDLDNPDVECSFLSTATVNSLCRNGSDDELHELSIYRVDNAFNRIQMGQNPHGIFMCAVVDVMHTVQHGIIMYSLESFKKGLGAQTLQLLDRMALSFNKTCCQTIRSSFPRTDFSRGITNLSLVECSEQSGALFFLAILTMQVQGWHALAGNKYGDNLEAVLGTLEAILCFEAWLEEPTYWNIGDPCGEAAVAEDAIAALIRLIVKFLPRDSGNGWKVSKLHEIKHIVRFITAFGAPRGYNASRPEEHHKAHAKRPGRRAHKNLDTIDQQCGRRIADAIVIDTMHAFFQEGVREGATLNNDKGAESGILPMLETFENGFHNDSSNAPTREEGRGTTYVIRSFRNPDDDNRLCCEVIFDTRTTAPIKLEDNLALFILQSYEETDLDDNLEGSVTCCTEYHKFDRRSNEKMIRIRCHPNYRGKGFAWYDWAFIRFEDDSGQTRDYPCRILSCIPRNNLGNESPSDTFDLVVQSCGQPTGRESILFTEWSFSRDFYIVPATALVTLCFVLVSNPTDGSVLVVKDKSQWASNFYDAAQIVYS
jgi:hypothetical protein